VTLDLSFDFRSDSHGKDPDAASKKLKSYHKLLWAKELPNGKFFDLRDDLKQFYLSFQDIEELHILTSDSIGNSFSNNKKMAKLFEQIDPAALKSFRDINSTIGGFILFPGNRIDGKATINGERGFNPLIADRFDLTLECIRRHYSNLASPLNSVLNRYSTFFKLFRNFKGYVDFFLLNDLVSADYESINFFNSNLQVFASSPLPKDVDSYLEYRDNSMLFIQRRNERMGSGFLH
jgi:hypothetical protein